MEKDEKEPKSSNKNLIIFLSVVLLFLGLFLIIFGSVQFRVTRDVSEEIDRVGVVIDAGGSGTRMLIYKYANYTMTQLDYIECEDRGLTKYTEEELPYVRNSLTECFQKGGATLPKENVPIYFAATAGMRLLRLRDRKSYDKIWALVQECIKASQFKMEIAETITGKDEAKWAWVAANYLKGSLSKDNNDTFGTIDLGSSSIQFTFEHEPNKTNIDDTKVQDLDGNDISIYAHSYLCFGAAEMERRFLAKLVTTANTTIVKNPCYFKDYSKELMSAYLFDEPCSKGKYAQEVLGESIDGPVNKTYIINGSGDFTQCYDLIKNLNSRMNCTQKDAQCGLNNLYQPKVHGKFLAMSTFWYASQNMKLPENSNKNDYHKSANDMCSHVWADAIKGVPAKSLKYAFNKCFQAAYGYYLLVNGFKFDNDTWKIEFVKKINDSNVGWTLGLIISHVGEMYPRLRHVLVTITRPDYIFMIIIGPLCILISILFACCVYKKSGKDEPV